MSYNIVQSVFLMSGASNGASGALGTQGTLTHRLDVFLNGGRIYHPLARKWSSYGGLFPMRNADLIGGDWSVAWGPAVYVKTPVEIGTVTNAMYVAQSPSQKTLVVAIAATNAISLYDWAVEDADVLPGQMSSWPPAIPFVPPAKGNPPPDPSKPSISAGTATGISDLLTQLTGPDATDAAKVKTLQQFLADFAKTGWTLIFTGHSLAGALSPTLAYYLYPDPTTSGWANIFVLPTAGASPGTPGFASAYNAAYPKTAVADGSGYFWNCDYASERDVVPHAWDRMAEVTQPEQNGLYLSLFGYLASTAAPGQIAPGPLAYGSVVLSEKLAGYSNGSTPYYQHLQMIQYTPQWDYFEWTITDIDGDYAYPPTLVPLPPYDQAAPMQTMQQFAQCLDATHVDQYSLFFNVAPIARMPDPDAGKIATGAATGVTKNMAG